MTNFAFLTTYSTTIQGLLVLLATVLLAYITKKIHLKLTQQYQQEEAVLMQLFLASLRQPLQALIGLLGITFALSLMPWAKSLDSGILLIKNLGIAGLAVWFFTRFIKRVETYFLTASQKDREHRIDPTTAHAFCQVLRVSVFIAGSLAVLQIVGVPISGVLAFGGVGGIAIGFAAKDLLANFFGALMVFLDQPFKVGDWVRSPDRSIEGTVEYIGWRLTRIRTFDKRPLYVPNGLFSTIIIENPSRMRNRRIKTVVGVRYQDANKLRGLLEEAETLLKKHPGIDTTQTLFVKFIEFGPYSLNFLIYTFTKTTNWVEFQSIQQDVLLKILDLIEQHDAECAFPTSTIHLKETALATPHAQ